MPSTPSLGHILIVDDDENIAELLQINLRSEGYTVDSAPMAEKVDFDSLDNTQLIIVDAMHQPYSGMDLIFDLKDNPSTEHIGVILYSSFKSERMVIDALDAGADDYIVKPFSLRELVARVKSVMRRHKASSAAPGRTINFDNMEVDLATQTVRLEGTPVSLSKTEFAILSILLKNVNSYVSRIEIHKKVWNDESAGANERIVDTNISRLRKKLGYIGERIVNRSGHGYMIS
jgi:two-component system phosphate regulon response regulator PhoB